MAVDPAAVARVKAALDLDHDEAVIAAALKASTPALNLRAIVVEVGRVSPWAANGSGRWKHTRGAAQIAAGTPGVRMAEMSDNGDSTVTAFLYQPDAGIDPNTNVGGQLDGMRALESKTMPQPANIAAAYTYLESAVTAGHLP